MKNSKIIFMGTPDIAEKYFQSLLSSNYNIVGVYTQPPKKKDRGLKLIKSPVHVSALKKNIPVFCPENFSYQNEIDKFKELNPDLVVVMAYGKIIPKKILSLSNYGFINIHLSLLPRWRGASPVEHAILYGDDTTGVTIFKLVEKLDEGPIIDVKTIKIEKEISKQGLLDQLNELGIELLNKIIPDYINNKISLKIQDNSKATYAKKILNEDRKINFNQNVVNVFNHIRAFSPKPAAWFLLKNERIKIINCHYKLCDSKSSIITNENFHIGCEGGEIIPKLIQREGKKPMKIDEFLKGFKFELFEKLNV